MTKNGKAMSKDLNSFIEEFYTGLLQDLSDPSDIGVVLRRVRERVMQETGGKQQPWEYGSLTGGELVLSALTSQR